MTSGQHEGRPPGNVHTCAGQDHDDAEVRGQAQAKVVARCIAAGPAGHQPATFSGAGAWFAGTGDQRAAFAFGNFCAPGGPQVCLHRPGPHRYLAKAVLEQHWMRRWA